MRVGGLHRPHAQPNASAAPRPGTAPTLTDGLAPGLEVVRGASQQPVPLRSAAHPGSACPPVSTGSASATSGWLDSPRYPMGPSGRSKGISSYLLAQGWWRQRRAGKHKRDSILLRGPHSCGPRIFPKGAEVFSSHFRYKHTGKILLTFLLQK